MATILMTIIALFIFVGLMSIGVIMGGEPIKGSCGGINALENGNCSLCGGEPDKCEELQNPDSLDPIGKVAQSYDATKTK